jgi:nucleotide-binding universal stress UspA family protein
MKNLLVSIDFEKHAGQLVDRAIELAKKFNSKIWLVHIAAPDPEFVGYEVGPRTVRDTRAKELKGERIILEKFATQLKETGIDAQSMLVEGPTIETLVRLIDKLEIELVIIGHHKRNLFYKTLIGNTDTALINRSDVPVLIVPLENAYSGEPFFQVTDENLEN